MDNTLLDEQNSLYPTQPHSIIAKYHMKVQPDTHWFLPDLEKEQNHKELNNLYPKKVLFNSLHLFGHTPGFYPD